MKRTVFKQAFAIFTMAALSVLFFACPDEINIQEQQGKAVVAFSVNDGMARTVLPQVSLADVASYRLRGGRGRTA